MPSKKQLKAAGQIYAVLAAWLLPLYVLPSGLEGLALIASLLVILAVGWLATASLTGMLDD